MEFTARRYDTTEPARFHVAADRIIAVETLSAKDKNSAAADSLPWIIPGLVDLQVNGYGGRDFSSPRLTIDDVAAVTTAQLSQGVARYLATVTTAPFDVLQHALATIAAACETLAGVSRHVVGIHLEGPYISAQVRAGPIRPLIAGGPIGTNSSDCKKPREVASGW